MPIIIQDDVVSISSNDEEPITQQNFSYSIKLINPRKKKDYRVYNIRDCAAFETMRSLEEFIKSKFSEFSDSANMMSIGYIEPGHGWKGKQLWLNNDDDIEDLYRACQKMKTILLWCYLPDITQKKHALTSKCRPPGSKSSKRAKCVENNGNKADEAKDVLEELRAKHGEKYTAEQLHAWAEMIQIKKHTSYDNPPNYPFFTGCKRREKESSATQCASSSTSSSLISPIRRLRVRTECLEQLQKVGELLEKGTISQAQFDKLQEAIMDDVSKY